MFKPTTLIFFLVLISVSPSDSQTLEQATYDLICSVYQPKLKQINILFQSEKFDMNFFLERIWSQTKLSLTFSISSTTEQFNERKTTFGIFICRNEKDFIEISSKISWDVLDTHGFYVIIFTQQGTVLGCSVYKVMWLKSFYNVDVLVERDNGVIELSTFYPFRKNQCRQNQPVTINFYSILPKEIG